LTARHASHASTLFSFKLFETPPKLGHPPSLPLRRAEVAFHEPFFSFTCVLREMLSPRPPSFLSLVSEAAKFASRRLEGRLSPPWFLLLSTSCSFTDDEFPVFPSSFQELAVELRWCCRSIFGVYHRFSSFYSKVFVFPMRPPSEVVSGGFSSRLQRRPSHLQRPPASRSFPVLPAIPFLEASLLVVAGACDRARRLRALCQTW